MNIGHHSDTAVRTRLELCASKARRLRLGHMLNQLATILSNRDVGADCNFQFCATDDFPLECSAIVLNPIGEPVPYDREVSCELSFRKLSL